MFESQTTGLEASGSVLTRHLLWYLVLFLFTSPLHAHVVEQVYSKFTADDQEWSLLLTFDIGLVEDESRDPNTPQKPREYLFTLTEAQHAEFRQKIETLVRSVVKMDPTNYQVSFPDYDKDPYDFPELRVGGAYVHVKLHAPIPSGKELVFELLPGPCPHFVVHIDREFKNVWPADRLTLLASQPSFAPQPSFDFAGFLRVGFVHVLPEGWDHVLFVMGLCLLQLRARPVLWQSLAFTIAHSITLGLAASGFLPQGGRWIEIFIAASIAVMGFSSLRGTSLNRWRLLLVTVFGLIHGLGFAGALADPLTESDQFLPALATMNLGVELAQIVVILAVLTMFFTIRSENYREILRRTLAILIGLAGFALTCERLLV